MHEELKNKAKEANAKGQADAKVRASLYHKTFVQNEAGKKILNGWVLNYSMAPIGDPNASHFKCGIAEGKRQIVKEIIDFISFIDNQKEG